MAGPLRQLLEERHLSARGLSLACGLAADTVRNLLSGRAHSPRGEVAQALADQLGVTVAQIYGREPLPAPPTALDRSQFDGAHVSEVVFVPRKDALPHKADHLEIKALHHWIVPPDLLAERQLVADTLIIVRSPEDGEGLRRGDRMLVDRSDVAASPPGIHLLWDGYGVRAVRCGVVRRAGGDLLRMEATAGAVEEVRLRKDVEILGRVLARWEWM